MDIINILEAVVSTMNTISVVGLDNQDKFVGCANALRTALKQLRDQAEAKTASIEKPQETCSQEVTDV